MHFEHRKPTFVPQRCLAVAALVALNLLAAVPAAQAEPDIAKTHMPTAKVTIAPGQADLRRYSREPGTIIIGDPDVAAASIATPDVLVLNGLTPGNTNVIVLDDTGVEIEHIALHVVVPGNTVVVRRGQERELLRCDPTCAPVDEPSLAAPASRPIGAPQGAAVPVAGETAPPT